MPTELSISNNFTDLGIKYFFDKIFDTSVEFNHMLYSDLNTLLKLRLYNQYGQYVISESEFIDLNENNEIELHYKFTIPVGTVMDIVTIRLLDMSNQEILVIENVGLSSVSTDSSYNSIEDVILKFQVASITENLTHEGITKITNSMMNQDNSKITKAFIGTGVPDLSGDSTILTNKVLESPISQIQYEGRSAVMRFYTQLTTTATEFGIGYSLSDSEYVLMMIQSVEFLANASGSGEQVIIHRVTVA